MSNIDRSLTHIVQSSYFDNKDEGINAVKPLTEVKVSCTKGNYKAKNNIRMTSQRKSLETHFSGEKNFYNSNIIITNT